VFSFFFITFFLFLVPDFAFCSLSLSLLFFSLSLPSTIKKKTVQKINSFLLRRRRVPFNKSTCRKRTGTNEETYFVFFELCVTQSRNFCQQLSPIFFSFHSAKIQNLASTNSSNNQRERKIKQEQNTNKSTHKIQKIQYNTHRHTQKKNASRILLFLCETTMKLKRNRKRKIKETKKINNQRARTNHNERGNPFSLF